MNGVVKKGSHVSMQDVADAAGVSKSTVSKVLNSRSDVSEKAIAKVLAACEKLGYSLNPSVQDLLRNGVAGHSHDVSFVIVGLEFANPANAGMIDGISLGAEKHNLHLNLSKLSGNESSVYSLPPAIRDHRAAGMLISGALTSEVISLIRETGIPYVVIGNYPSVISSYSSSVELNIGNLMHLAARELKANGKSRAAIFFENTDNFFSRECFSAFRQALEGNDMPFFPELVFEGRGGDFNAFNVMEKALLKKELMFDSIISFNFFASQEIACQLIAKFGRENAQQIMLVTAADYTKKMPLPTIFFEETTSKLASIGMDVLMETLKNPGSENKCISFTPNLRLCFPDFSLSKY